MGRLRWDPRARAVVAGATTDLRTAATRVSDDSDSLEVEHVERWLDTVESQLHLLLGAFGAAAPPRQSSSRA